MKAFLDGGGGTKGFLMKPEDLGWLWAGARGVAVDLLKAAILSRKDPTGLSSSSVDVGERGGLEFSDLVLGFAKLFRFVVWSFEGGFCSARVAAGCLGGDFTGSSAGAAGGAAFFESSC